jgi:DNA-binding SARP family transcriptional activator
VRCGGAVVPVPPGKQRAVLAALLLDNAQVVSLDQLADVLWGSSPPRTARVSVRN